MATGFDRRQPEHPAAVLPPPASPRRAARRCSLAPHLDGKRRSSPKKSKCNENSTQESSNKSEGRGGVGGGISFGCRAAKIGVICDVTGHCWMRVNTRARSLLSSQTPCRDSARRQMALFDPHWLRADLLTAWGVGGGWGLILPSCLLDVSKGLCFDPAGSFQLLFSRKEYWKLDCTTPTICSAVVFSRPPRVAPKIIFRLLSNIFTHPVFRRGMDGS